LLKVQYWTNRPKSLSHTVYHVCQADSHQDKCIKHCLMDIRNRRKTKQGRGRELSGVKWGEVKTYIPSWWQQGAEEMPQSGAWKARNLVKAGLQQVRGPTREKD
jgi:hypothetical protein